APCGGGDRGRDAWSFSVSNYGNRSPDRQRVPLLGQYLRQRPRDITLVGHVRLVGLNFNELITDGDLVPDLLHPLEHGPLLHRVRQPRHDALGHQGIAPSRVARAAETMCSWWGMAACSRRLE